MLFPQAQMAEDARYYVRFMDEVYDFHLIAASGIAERAHFPTFHHDRQRAWGVGRPGHGGPGRVQPADDRRECWAPRGELRVRLPVMMKYLSDANNN